MVRKVVVKQLPPSSGRPKCVGSARLQLTGGGVFFVFVGFFFSLSFRCGSRGCSDDSVRRPRPATGPSRAPVHTHTHLHTHTHTLTHSHTHTQTHQRESFKSLKQPSVPSRCTDPLPVCYFIPDSQTICSSCCFLVGFVCVFAIECSFGRVCVWKKLKVFSSRIVIDIFSFVRSSFP